MGPRPVWLATRFTCLLSQQVNPYTDVSPKITIIKLIRSNGRRLPFSVSTFFFHLRFLPFFILPSVVLLLLLVLLPSPPPTFLASFLHSPAFCSLFFLLYIYLVLRKVFRKCINSGTCFLKFFFFSGVLFTLSTCYNVLLSSRLLKIK